RVTRPRDATEERACDPWARILRPPGYTTDRCRRTARSARNTTRPRRPSSLPIAPVPSPLAARCAARARADQLEGCKEGDARRMRRRRWISREYSREPIWLRGAQRRTHIIVTQ